MAIETTIYAKLSGDGTLNTLTAGRINPTVGTDGSAVPCLTFTVTNTATSLCLDGPSSLEQHTLVVDTWATTAAEVNAVMDAAKAALHGWREGRVQICTLEGYSTDRQDDSERYHGQQTFNVWATAA